MSKENVSKIRILRILEILYKDSDEQHPIDTNTLIDQLKCMGILCDRRTLYDDINTLIDGGYNVVRINKNGCSSLYYIEKRYFNETELRVLVDAVQSAKFIPVNLSNELEEKVRNLGGTYLSQSLQDNTIFNDIKYLNKNIYVNIELINKAIQEKRYIEYSYINYGIDKKPTQRFAGKSVPIGLVIKDGNYYFIRYIKKFGVKGLRVDLMDNIKLCQESFGDLSDFEDLKDFQDDMFVKTSFDLFYDADIKTEDVTIQTSKLWVSDVYEKFGADVTIKEIDEHVLQFTESVQVGEAFFGWLATNSRKFKIIKPQNVKAQYISFLNRALSEVTNENKRMKRDLEVLNFNPPNK